MDRWVPCYPGEAELCFEIIIGKNDIVTTKGGETYKGAMDVFTSELDAPDELFFEAASMAASLQKNRMIWEYSCKLVRNIGGCCVVNRTKK